MSAVLIVDDEVRFIEAAAAFLDAQGHEVATAGSLQAANTALQTSAFDVLIVDLKLSDGSGLALLDTPAERRPAKTIVITGHHRLKASIAHMHGPALTYLTKPVDLEILAQYCASPERVAGDSCPVTRHFDLLVGDHDEMQLVYEQIRQVAKTHSSVLIMGESGTGKELIAQAIHCESARPGPLVPLNCGALSSELIASELFGHEKGSFTGADKRHIGAFERANDGTLFLDEVTEMPLDQQPHLLRVIENQEIRRVGGSHTIPVSTRIISATNRHLADSVAGGRLREDLYYRLGVFPIMLPPLRDRPEDIHLLVAHAVATLNRQYGRSAAVRPKDMERFESWHWPGNVRELRHAVHRAFVATPADETMLKVPERLGDARLHSACNSGNNAMTLRERERDHILATLREQNGSRKKSAELLGISPKTLYNRISGYQQNGDDEFLAFR